MFGDEIDHVDESRESIYFEPFINPSSPSEGNRRPIKLQSLRREATMPITPGAMIRQTAME